ncbi:Leucine-rich repeat protein kinase family protein [Abeliophyllum distichum]|uniref:Leucine-rich repeat protein kinase family protein n=1 Tax=Abeliophyllum distichum TaxID=126358 RepID=A0ABD1SEU9_9LAMI
MRIQCFLQNLLIFLSVYFHSGASSSPSKTLLQPSDAAALLAFKSKADLNNKLGFSPKTSFAFCKWNGVQCTDSRAVRVIIEGIKLGGTFAPNSLSRLAELRVLSLQNNSLKGPIPDLSGLVNLKSLFLSHNYFSGFIPPSISTLHRLKTLDLSYNMFTGLVPVSLNSLERLYYLRLDYNRFNGSVPPLNQSTLQIFNVSHNDLNGAIPVTPTLSRFKASSFSLNPRLCGEIIHKECRPVQPFFGSSPSPQPASPALSQTAQFHGGGVALAQQNKDTQKRKKTAFIIGFSSGVFILLMSSICLIFTVKKVRQASKIEGSKSMGLDSSVTGNVEAVIRIEEENNELEEKVRRLQQGMHMQMVGKSGSLSFCAGESQVYSMDQLMTASAQLLGRGSMGTTYKAVLDSRLIVTVKRLDAGRLRGASQEVFEGHMESVGGLRHPNLVPLRAYFQGKEERLLVYDYQPNGSLSSLIHGSKSSRAKPLHWTSCLKIAEDVAQGLSYIHQAWRLVHGNLKSSNVLLGSDFEACLTDYCLVALASPSMEDDPDSTSYKAPELRKFNHREATSKSDVYSFGVLLLELLSGRHPSQHPYLTPDDMTKWMKSSRDEDGQEDNRMEMLLDVAMACSVTSPEQRPTMWDVLKMIQEIKEACDRGG